MKKKEMNLAPMERVKKKKLRLGERAIETTMLICALASVAAVVLITVMIFSEGLPLFKDVSLWDFISGEKWKPTKDIYGILPMIVGTIMGRMP